MKLTTANKKKIRQLAKSGKYSFVAIGKMFSIAPGYAGTICKDLRKNKYHLDIIDTPKGKFRICKKCNSIKGLEEFRPDARCKGGYRGDCLICSRRENTPQKKIRDRIYRKKIYWSARLATTNLTTAVQESLLKVILQQTARVYWTRLLNLK